MDPPSQVAVPPAPGPAPAPAGVPEGRPERSRGALALGLAGVLLAFTVLAGLHALSVRPFLPADEMPHTGYALLVGRGRLPTLTTPTPLLPRMPRAYQNRLRVYTANHPPLYYALVALPLRLGVATGHPMVGFAAARLLTVLLGGAGVLAVAGLALVLAPGRPQLAVAAAGVGSLVPSFVHISGLVHNDAAGFTTATATLALSALVLVRGPSRGRVAALATAAAAAALTRASGLPFAAAAVLAAGLAPLVHLEGSGEPGTDTPEDRGQRRWRTAVAGARDAGVVAGVTALAAGWFYLRNRALYGDIGGTAANLRQFGMRPRGSPDQFLLSAGFWSRIFDQLWGRFADMQFLAKDALAVPGRVVGVLAAAGLALGGARLLARRARPRPAAGVLLAWLLALGMVPLLMVALATYVAQGGGAHARYLYPGLGVLGLVAAAGLAELPGHRRGLAAIAVLAGEVVLNLLLWATFLSRTSRGRPSLAGAVVGAVRATTGLPAWPVCGVAALLLAAALGMCARALWLLAAEEATG